MEFVEQLHNFQIMLILKRYNLFVGPVENTTRGVYLKRLAAYYNAYPQMVNDTFDYFQSLHSI
jgi:hypothetical protein